MSICQHCGQPSGAGRFCSHCGIALLDLPAAPSAQAPAGLWQPLPVGAVLEGRYTICGLINRGSFGAVYEVEDNRFAGQRRALKELLPVVLTAQEFGEAKAWFLREAQMLGELNHPSIPRVWDSFEDHGRLYIVMQFIEGRTLEDLLADQAGAGLPARQVLGWTRAICEVLEYLHGHTPPVLFRDLKPANVMQAADGRLMLIDFGIATRFAPQRVGTTIGTPGYAPPEQYQGLATPQSDLYALAATVHHLLTGRDPTKEPPFSFPPLDAAALAIPASLAALVDQALRFVIAERPATVQEFRAALAPGAGPTLPVSPSVIRYDLRHASRVASKGWSSPQRALAPGRMPQDIDALHQEAERLEEAGRFNEATVVSDQAVALQLVALRGEAARWEGVGHYAKAVATIDQALGLQRGDPDLWRERGRLLRLAGRPADAVSAFRESLTLEPDHAHTLSNMGWCLAHMGRHEEALAVLEKVLVLDPLDTDAWAARGWSLACLRRLHEALRALDEAIAIDPRHADAWRTRGWCLERLGREGEAMQAFRQAKRTG